VSKRPAQHRATTIGNHQPVYHRCSGSGTSCCGGAEQHRNNPYGNKNAEFNTYYEGPTDGFYRIGSSRMNYYSQHFSHFHPAPLMMMNANSVKLNAIYRSSEDGSSFALPTTQLTASTPPPSTNPIYNNNNGVYGSYSSSIDNNHQSMPQQHFSNFQSSHAVSSHHRSTGANQQNSNKVVYFNNISWWPSKIMSEHELRKFINYNYYFDANNVNNVSNIASSFHQPTARPSLAADNTNNTTGNNNYNNKHMNNLVHLRQNFSDLGLMLNSKSQQHLIAKQQQHQGATAGKGFNARLKKKVFSTSSNLFNNIGCSSFRLSSTTEYNYSRLAWNFYSENFLICL
jgi:hypothetical protein